VQTATDWARATRDGDEALALARDATLVAVAPAAARPHGPSFGTLVHLAFEDGGGWTVVDFKTDAEIAGGLASYRRQVRHAGVRRSAQRPWSP